MEEQKQTSQRFFSREELARRWGISYRTVQRMELDGRLPGVVHLSDQIVRIPASVVEQCESRKAGAVS
jgi:predicted DNA-binding transcriptional regulator AlpA